MSDEQMSAGPYLREIDRLKVIISEMSLMIGFLRGTLFQFQIEMSNDQIETIKRIDKRIESLFYSHYFRPNEVSR